MARQRRATGNQRPERPKNGTQPGRSLDGVRRLVDEAIHADFMTMPRARKVKRIEEPTVAHEREGERSAAVWGWIWDRRKSEVQFRVCGVSDFDPTGGYLPV